MAYALQFTDSTYYVPWRGQSPTTDVSAALAFQSREEAAKFAIANYITEVDRLYGKSPVMIVGLPDTSDYGRFELPNGGAEMSGL